ITSTSCPASATSAIASTERHDEEEAPDRETAGSAARAAREVADGADAHRAEQDPRPRLPARRDHGAPHLRRGDLPAADGRSPLAGDRQPDGSDPRVVHRSRDHAAVHARRAQYGHDRRPPPPAPPPPRARLPPASPPPHPH